MADVVTADDLQVRVSGLDALFARVAGRFGRVEPRRQARAYVTGLLAPVERKNGTRSGRRNTVRTGCAQAVHKIVTAMSARDAAAARDDRSWCFRRG
uniref:hypothetical protein n=1 Tax=Actinoallomurus rhizosphaericola TaxID=2952536 RepID=UPI003873A583